MKLYSETGDFKLYHGSMLDMLQVIAPSSVDSIVTDPPYGLTTITKRFSSENAAPNVYGRDGSFARLTRGFMGKEWDGSGIEYNVEAWRKCFTVLKSGGYLLAFGGSRTFHRIACAIEDAGFEIRDTIMWLYGSGFPKSMNIGMLIDKKNGVQGEVIGTYKEHDIRNNNYNSDEAEQRYFTREIRKCTNEWDGWGTALKPAYEPVIVARKPCEGSCVDNVIKYRTGGININGCRVGDDLIKGGTMPIMGAGETGVCNFATVGADRTECEDHYGRYPSNVILTYDSTDFDEVCGGMPDTKSTQAQGIHRNSRNGNTVFSNTSCGFNNSRYDSRKLEGFDDEGSAARYFYTAKASKRDRDEGLGKEFDSLELILYCCDGGKEIWKDTITTKEENPAMHLMDMAASIEKAIAEFGMQPKSDTGLNMLLFGNSILAKYLKENKYITKMGISSTTGSKILNLLMPYTIKDYIQGANCEMEYGLSLVKSAVSSNLLTITIKEKMALVHGAKPVVFKMQFRINEKEKHSTHPTVKPTDLMQYLVRLVTPAGGTVLDPFNGSGSTGKACMYENRDRNAGYKYIGIELTEEYLPIADARIRFAAGDTSPVELPEKPLQGQITFFDILGGQDE